MLFIFSDTAAAAKMATFEFISLIHSILSSNSSIENIRLSKWRVELLTWNMGEPGGISG